MNRYTDLGPEWRNWQTRRTQNPLSFTGRVGSIPSSGTSWPGLFGITRDPRDLREPTRPTRPTRPCLYFCAFWRTVNRSEEGRVRSPVRRQWFEPSLEVVIALIIGAFFVASFVLNR
jgi:hypothetical protein